MKRFLALASAIVLAFSLAACGGDKDKASDAASDAATEKATDAATEEATDAATEEATDAATEEATEEAPAVNLNGMTINFGNWDQNWSKPDESSASGQREKAWQDELEIKYNFKFSWDALPSADYLPTVQSSILAGDPIYDVINFMLDSVPNFAAKGLLFPLDTLKNCDFVNHPYLVKEVRDASTWADGHVYGWRISTWVEMGSKIFDVFNKRIAESLGVDMYALRDNGDWTWSKFEELAALATKDTDGDGINNQWGYSGDKTLMALGYVGSTGFQMLDAQNKIHYNSPEVVSALSELPKVKPYYNAPPEGGNWDYYMMAFAEGNTLFGHGNQSWNTGRYMDMVDDWGMIPFPMPKKGDGYKTSTDIDGCEAMPYNAENPEGVALIIKILRDWRPWEYDENGNPPDRTINNRQWFYDMYTYAVRDEESLKTVEMLHWGDIPCIFDRQRMFNVFWTDPGFLSMYQAVWDGTMTPDQAIQANEAPVQAAIDAYIAEAQKK